MKEKEIMENVESLLSVNTPYKVNRPKRKEKVTKILVDSFWYDPGFTTLYKSSNDITFFNTTNRDAQKCLAGELYFSCRNGNYYHYGEYSLEKEKIELTLYKWNLYYVIRCTETTIENQILDK